jgi:hypothetical protein
LKLNEDDGEQELLEIDRLDLEINSIGKAPKDTWIPIAFVDLGLEQLKM